VFNFDLRYFFAGILLGLAVRLYFKANELNIAKRKNADQEQARRERVAALYGMPTDNNDI
jgi:hypothetical protein